jgi:putative alpha-1,2-mannosidase
MAAWYILSALGLFALCPGKPEWALGAPFFPSAEIRFPDGRGIHIDAYRHPFAVLGLEGPSQKIE